MGKRSLVASIQTLLCAVGTLDAGFLFYSHVKGISLPCSNDGGCDIVNNSHWAFITLVGHQVPLSFFGLLTYVVLLFASIVRLTTESEILARRVNVAIVVATLATTCYSWYLQYVAAVLIGEYCKYCRVSAITMTLIFVVSVIGLALSRTAPAPPVASKQSAA